MIMYASPNNTELAIARKTLLSLTGHADSAAPADPTIASPAYQQILAVFFTASSAMRASSALLGRCGVSLVRGSWWCLAAVRG
ncbi:hypothetical protein AB0873_29010 [Micromonospora sp. NPDC047707]|uniref:hypothetical protein n=1 Tax=Micromonospora sp. NPDC047707 TaxID=3154498 RepID=UPI003456D890